MQQVVYHTDDPPFTWLDVTAPTPEELNELGARYNLQPTAVQDCLDPEHLPKYERFGDTNFLIFRVFDPNAPESASTVQQLTRKIAIFSRPELTLTIHRIDLPIVQVLRDRFGGERARLLCSPLVLLAAGANAVLDSYERPLQQAEDAVDLYEEGLFSSDTKTPSLHRIHVLKRRVSLIKRLLWQTQSVIQRLTPTGERTNSVYQDLKENAESYHFWADELHEEAHNLLSMQVALASHRTNEVMRVLTVFSAFFLPLTFVVGVYGMNFQHMPEIRARWGYPAVLVVMAVISLSIFVWFRKRGWLGRSRT
jgi:magnesium transporter